VKALFLLLLAVAAVAQPIIVKTTTLIDGKGRILRNQQISIENGRITRIAAAKDKPTFDLSGLTVLPGWIDTHVHPTWYLQQSRPVGAGRSRSRFVRGGQSLCHAARRIHDRAKRRR